MLRERLQAALKEASEQVDERRITMLRLVLAAIKEREHAARAGMGVPGMRDQEIEELLREMIEQRREEIARCETQARLDQAEQEAQEIGILESFLPRPLGEAAIRKAVDEAIRAVGAVKLKDTGRVITWLKERHDGQMDFSLARRMACERLQ